jgi:ATP-dependent DNA helicase DinG
MKAKQELKLDAVMQILQTNGLLSQKLKGFEPREAQQQMMRDIIDAYNDSHISLIEAGTGTGKSIAYLIPAIIWASLYKETTLISTNTINLQEQLIHKDIPLLTKALNLDVKAVLVKGMHNYICLRKLDEARQSLRLFSLEDAAEIERIEECKELSKDGSRSELPFVPSSHVWEKVNAEKDTCNNRECPHFQECHFFKARRNANDANILVANHHMLFADLVCRAEENNYTKPSIMPPYKRIILDEAHNIEDTATEYFATKTSQWGIMHTLGRLSSEKRGKLPLLKEKFQKHFSKHPAKEVTPIFSRLNIDLPAMRQDLLRQLSDTFLIYEDFIRKSSGNNQSEEPSENKLRLLQHHVKNAEWTAQIIPQTKQLINAMQQYALAIFSLNKEMIGLKNERFVEESKGIRFEIEGIAERLTKASTVLTHFISDTIPPTRVRWMDSQNLKGGTNIHLVDAELDVAPSLVEYLFSKFPTIILCSATLTTNKKFDFIKQRFGLIPELLKGKKVTEHIYDSPFDYSKQAMFVIPKDIPQPHEANYHESAVENIWQAIEASKGNAFILFTSYGMLKSCYDLLSARLFENRYVTFKQGDDNRQSLINKFKTTERSVLFGTDSFWEGVDVSGDALRCVIIVKLPFKVPSEPIIQARTEAISAKGGDPFNDYSLPNAIVKFKQGFGRLIRNKNDRGCIVCLDSRLLNKGYGKMFLNSLPNCRQAFIEGSSISHQMSEFYRKTYYMVQNSNKQ